MMAELNPMPFGRCGGPWRERQHRTVPTIGRSGKGFCRFCAFLSQLPLQQAFSPRSTVMDLCIQILASPVAARLKS